jgi:hypothetical protein
VPVGWNERAVGFKVVPLPLAVTVSSMIAPGAMLDSSVDANVGYG